jgi:hypothetical protein
MIGAQNTIKDARQARGDQQQRDGHRTCDQAPILRPIERCVAVVLCL